MRISGPPADQSCASNQRMGIFRPPGRRDACHSNRSALQRPGPDPGPGRSAVAPFAAVRGCYRRDSINRQIIAHTRSCNRIARSARRPSMTPMPTSICNATRASFAEPYAIRRWWRRSLPSRPSLSARFNGTLDEARMAWSERLGRKPQYHPLRAPRVQILGAASMAMSFASSRRGNDEDVPVPPQPAGLTRFAADLFVSRRRRSAGTTTSSSRLDLDNKPSQRAALWPPTEPLGAGPASLSAFDGVDGGDKRAPGELESGGGVISWCGHGRFLLVHSAPQCRWGRPCQGSPSAATSGLP